MTYNQENVKKMGRIIANRDKINIKELISKYKDIFRDSMLYTAEKTSNINVLMHSLGYFQKPLVE